MRAIRGDPREVARREAWLQRALRERMRDALGVGVGVEPQRRGVPYVEHAARHESVHGCREIGGAVYVRLRRDGRDDGSDRDVATARRA